MTEAIIITTIIVGGLVALAWIVLHFAFKAWRTQQQSAGDGSVQVQVAGDFDAVAARKLADKYRHYSAN